MRDSYIPMKVCFCDLYAVSRQCWANYYIHYVSWFHNFVTSIFAFLWQKVICVLDKKILWYKLEQIKLIKFYSVVYIFTLLWNLIKCIYWILKDMILRPWAPSHDFTMCVFMLYRCTYTNRLQITDTSFKGNPTILELCLLLKPHFWNMVYICKTKFWDIFIRVSFFIGCIENNLFKENTIFENLLNRL